jgi:hypothetical protein
MEEERLQILKMVEAGQIDVEEAAKLLAALDAADADGDADADADADAGVEVEEEEVLPPAAPQPVPGEGWTRFWIYPLLAGSVVLILGAAIMSLVYSLDAARGWLVCAWLPMILGAIVIALAWWSRQARWLHLRISEGNKRKMAFSFPLPLGLAAWVLRIAQPFVPQLRETGVDDLIIALRDGALQDGPLFVDVQDDEQGERVELYIG